MIILDISRGNKIEATRTIKCIATIYNIKREENFVRYALLGSEIARVSILISLNSWTNKNNIFKIVPRERPFGQNHIYRSTKRVNRSSTTAIESCKAQKIFDGPKSKCRSCSSC